MDRAADLPDLEALLAEASWVRRLAGGLVGEASADDLAQRTMLQALEFPPPDRHRLKGWLATVARNLALQDRRRRSRRRRREEMAAKPDHHPSTSELVGKVEVQRLVSQAVIGLDEPYRTALLLRYFEDLPPRKIAARLGLPVRTIETRLRRGRERLRKRLDELHQGERSSWLPAIAALAPPGSLPGAGVLGLGGIALGMKTTVAAGAVLIALGIVFWPERASRGPDSVESETGIQIAKASGPPEGVELAMAAGTVPDPQSRTKILTAASAEDRLLVLRVFEKGSGEVIPGCEIEVTWLADTPEFQERRRKLTPGQIYDFSNTHVKGREVVRVDAGICGEDGKWNMLWPEGGAALEIRVPTTPGHFGIHRGTWVPMEMRLPSRYPVFPLMLAKRLGRAHGRVVDQDGREVPGATVQVWAESRLHPYREPDGVFPADARGAFAIEGLWSEYGRATLSAVAPGLVAVRRFCMSGAGEDEDVGPIVLQLYPGRSVEGRVVDSAGAPVPGVELSIWRAYSTKITETPPQGRYLDEVGYRVLSDEEGRFFLPAVSRQRFQIQADHPEHRMWRGFLEGDQDAITVELEDTPPILVRVLGPDGTPSVGATVRAESWSFHENYLTDEEGKCEFRGPLPEEDLLLGVLAEGAAMELLGPLTVSRDPQVVEVGLKPELIIRGMLVDADGRPLGGRDLMIQGPRRVPSGDSILAGEPWTRFFALTRTKTDRDGGFQFSKLLAGSYEIRVLDRRKVEAVVQAMAGRDDLTLVLGQGMASWTAFVGRVSDQTTGEPVPCTIRLQRFTEDGREDRERWGPFFRAGKDGRFEITGIEPGPWVLYFQEQGFAGWASPLRNYRLGEHRIDVTLGPERGVNLLLEDRDGNPLSHIQVRVRGEAGQELPFRDASPPSGGRTVGGSDPEGKVGVFGLPSFRDIEIEFRHQRSGATHRILLSSLQDTEEPQRVVLPFSERD